ncbi:4187_t:CDS:1, partial [Dentiscutata heterogama]
FVVDYLNTKKKPQKELISKFLESRSFIFVRLSSNYLEEDATAQNVMVVRYCYKT